MDRPLFRQRPFTLYLVFQADSPFQEFHNEIGPQLRIFFKIKDLHDILVLDVVGGLRFEEEALNQDTIGAVLPAENFDGDFPAYELVARPKHCAYPSDAQDSRQLIIAKATADVFPEFLLGILVKRTAGKDVFWVHALSKQMRSRGKYSTFRGKRTCFLPGCVFLRTSTGQEPCVISRRMQVFKNLEERPRASFGKLLKWKVVDRLKGLTPKHPSRVEIPCVEPEIRRLRTERDPSVTWIGHATYLVQLQGRSILTDPVMGERIAILPRNVPPGIDLAAMPRIAVVTISHNHRDHLDVPSIKRLGPEPTYLVPKGLKKFFVRLGVPKVIELGWWESAQVEGVTFTFVPSQHWSRRGAFDENKSWWGGWVMKGGGRTVWHAGDTAYFRGFSEIGRRIGPIDAALLPIGAYEPRWFMQNQHMNPQEAVRAFQDVGAHLFCAMHWGTFKLTDEPLDEPPRLLQEAWQEQNLPASRLFLARIGETYWL